MDFLNQLYEILPLTPLATNIGLVCLISQLALTLLFQSKLLPKGPWSSLPAFTAHQVVTLPLMIILTYYGFQEWFFDSAGFASSGSMATSQDRIFRTSDPNDIPLAIGTGAILLWDIPCGIFVPSLQDPIMLLHHIGMYFVAAVISGTFCQKHQMVGYYYASFFFGVVELSSVFLTYVDVFHPKRKAWYEWMHANHTNANLNALTSLLNSGNEVARMAFALAFLTLRGIYFPYVVFCNAIPDLRIAFQNPPEGVPMWTCYFLSGSMCLFAILQAYWGLLIAGQVKKALFGDGGKDKKKSDGGKKKD